MNPIEIVHPVDVDAAEPWLRALITTLLGDPHSDDVADRLASRVRTWEPHRTWGVLDRGRWVATLATHERSVAVPGAGTSTNDLTADALTAVTVAATHRRRGLLTAMLTQSLQAAKARAAASVSPIAAEWPIYGRFGYAPAVDVSEWRYHPRRRGAAPTAGDASRVRQVEPAELGPIAAGIYDRARRRRAGEVDRRAPWWDRRLGLDGHATVGPKLNWFVHDGDDGPDGLLAWRVSRDFELSGPLGAIRVEEFAAATDTAYVDLWAYLGGIDVVDEIELGGTTDEPIRWLLGDGRTLQQTELVDHLWLRLLDVPAALSARGYSREGYVVLDVVDDDLGGFAAGRYAVKAAPSGAQCVPTDAAPDLHISQRALASIYLGGHRLHQRTLTGDVVELTPGALDLVDTLFAIPRAASNQTMF